MRLTDQQLSDLDSFDWFADGTDSIWGEDAYDAITSLTHHRSFDLGEWSSYVHYMFLTRPHMAPTENFCRRVALWYYKGEKFSVSEAEDANVGDLLKAYFLGALPRIDSLTFTEGQIERIVNWLAAGRRRTGDEVDGFAFLDAWFNHPQATSEHVRHFVKTALQSQYVDAELVLAANSSDLTPTDILEGLSRTVQKAVVKAKKMSGDSGYRWRFVFEYLSGFYSLPENRKVIRGSIRRKFKRHHEGRFDISGYYEDADLFHPKPLFQPIDTDLDSFVWEHAWQEAATSTYQRRNSGVKETAMAFGVGADGIPPGIAMQIASNVLAAVSKGDSAVNGRLSVSRNFWVLPYLDAARKWIVEQSGLGADHVPFEWVVEIMGIGGEAGADAKFLSEGWKQAQEVRRVG